MGSPKSARCLVFFSLTLSLVAIAGIVTLVVLWHKKLNPFQDYAIVVDAGSTHSKIFLYTWPADKSNGLGTTSRVSQETSCDNKNGPITSIKNPTVETVRQYFDPAMSDCVGKIPQTRRNRALIFLGGTAGLRLYNEQNQEQTNRLLNATRTYFDTLGLLFRAPEYQVRIINGSEEGLSGWISTNMLLRRLFSDASPPETFGVSDLGGASTQITFYAPNASNDNYKMNLFDEDYDLYSHSYLCYGIEQVRRVYLARLIKESNGSLIVDDPCLQRGYVQNRTFDDIFGTPCVTDQIAAAFSLNSNSTFQLNGVGNSTACTAAIQDRFNKSQCVNKDCSFNGVYQPQPISPDLQFVGISNGWFATFDTLAPNVTISQNAQGNYDFNNVTLDQIRRAINGICDQSWSEVPSPNQFRPALCFNSMYQWTLYEYGYNMTNENLKNFHVVKQIGADEIGWTLGYMINQTNSLDAEYRPARLLTQGEFIGALIIACAIFVASSIFAFFNWKNFTRRRDFKN